MLELPLDRPYVLDPVHHRHLLQRSLGPTVRGTLRRREELIVRRSYERGNNPVVLRQKLGRGIVAQRGRVHDERQRCAFRALVRPAMENK